MKSTSNFKSKAFIKRSDAHLHLEGRADLAQYLRDNQIRALVNCQSVEEWQLNHELLVGAELVNYSFGIHPWEADQSLQGLENYYQAAAVIGEIGLDAVWTNLDMDQQMSTFIQQLEIAEALNKPVILHTKGCEAEVLAIIQDYDLTYYVHWYSNEDYLEDYINLGAYLSVGPDISSNPAVRSVARQVPLNRLLLESDGLSAIAWAHGSDESHVLDLSQYSQQMLATAQSIAELRQIDLETVLANSYNNFERLLKIQGVSIAEHLSYKLSADR